MRMKTWAISCAIVFGIVAAYLMIQSKDGIKVSQLIGPTEQLVCREDSGLSFEQINKRFRELADSSQSKLALNEIEKYLSPNCKIVNSDKNKFSALESGLNAVRQVTNELLLSDYLIDSKNSNPQFRIFLINSIISKTSTASVDEVIFSRLMPEISVPQNLTEEGKEWEKSHSNIYPSLSGPDWVQSRFGPAALITNPSTMAGWMLFGKNQNPGLRDWIETSTNPELTTFISSGGEFKGWLEISALDTPDGIDRDTICKYRVTLSTFEPTGLVERFNTPMSRNCYEFMRARSSGRDLYTSDAKERLKKNIAMALGAPPIFVDVVDLERRDSGDKALIEAALMHPFGTFPVIDFVFSNAFASFLVNGAYDFKGVEPEICDSNFSRFKKSIEWALPNNGTTSEQIFADVANIQIICTSIRRFADQLNKNKHIVSNGGELLPPKRVLLEREIGPNDNVRRGLFEHIYIAFDITDRRSPKRIIIETNTDLAALSRKNQFANLNLQLFSIPPDIKIYINGFWETPETFVYDPLLVQEREKAEKDIRTTQQELKNNLESLRAALASLHDLLPNYGQIN